MNNAAGEVVTVTCELVGGYRVPANGYQSPVVQALTEMSRLLAALEHDFHSYAKTVVLQEKNQQDIISVIARQDHCSVHTAVTKAISLRDRIMDAIKIGLVGAGSTVMAVSWPDRVCR